MKESAASGRGTLTWLNLGFLPASMARPWDGQHVVGEGTTELKLGRWERRLGVLGMIDLEQRWL